MKRLRQTRYHAAASALRLEPAEAARFPLYAGSGRKHLRYAESRLPQSLRVHRGNQRPDKTASFLYALGWTQHSIGAQNIRTMAMIQLLLGNMGMAGGGVNALRGHSNIQGLTDLGLLSQSLPGYMTLPSEKQTDLQTYLPPTRRNRC
jgi:hypothetical protein